MSPLLQAWPLSSRAMRLRARNLGIGVVVTAIGLLRPSTASADSVRVEAKDHVPVEAKDLFSRGRELRLQGQCASAIPLFWRAHAVYPQGLGSLRNVAECEESLGHFDAAHKAWLDLSLALRTNQEAKYDGWAKDAAEGAARTAGHAASLTRDVPRGAASGSSPGGVASGNASSRAASGNASSRAASDTAPTGAASGGSPSGAFSGDASSGAVAGGATGDSSAQASTTPSDAAPRALGNGPHHGPDATQTAAWAAFGIGGASFIGAGIAGLVYLSASDDLAQTCPMSTCRPSDRSRVQEITNRGNTAQTVGLVLLTAGFVGAATGLVLWTTRHEPSSSASTSAWSPSASTSASPSASASAWLSVSPWGATMAGRF